jgi:hypothetical protein
VNKVDAYALECITLSLAADLGRVDIVQTLLEHGADVDKEMLMTRRRFSLQHAKDM